MADVRLSAAALVASLLLGACGARAPVVPAPAADPRPGIGRLVARGCYTCLEEAHAAASAAGVDDAAFEAALLLALRSKELGLPHEPWVARARERSPQWAAWGEYIDIVLSVPPDPLSADRDDLLKDAAAYRKPRETLDRWRQSLVGGPASPLFRAYLDMSLACGPLLFRQRDAAMDAALQAFGQVPLIAYRAGVCGRFTLLAQARGGDVSGRGSRGAAAMVAPRSREKGPHSSYRLRHQAGRHAGARHGTSSARRS